MLRVTQINLQHSKCASANLLVFLLEEDIDIALIQEPWVGSDRTIKGLQSKYFNLFHSTGDADQAKPRACILARKSLHAFLCPDLSSSDLVVVKLEQVGAENVYISSAYMAHDRSAPPQELQHLTNTITPKKANLLIGCDANARHTLWGSSEINERGESFFDFIITSNLSVCNRGSTPTFHFPCSENCDGWEEVLDITLITDNGILRVEDWRVSDQRSFSDHSWILFSLDLAAEVSKPFRDPRRIDWRKFGQVIKNKLSGAQIGRIGTTDELESKVGALEKAFDTAFKVSCPAKYSKKTLPPWWNEDLSSLRKLTREIFNICYRQKYWQPYKDCLKKYKSAIRTAKRRSWLDYCQNIESTSESARLSKILSKEHKSPSFLKKSEGSWTESSSETLELLVQTHFPSSEEDCESEPRLEGLRQPQLCETIKSVITGDRIGWAINSFSAYKSPGPDGIMPVMLQKQQERVVPWLVEIYRSCITLGYVPQSWRRARVVFIPKAGRRGHESAKDFRPISLTSFVLKTLERVLDIHLRTIMERTPFSKSQHAYLKGKSTETALHEVIGTVERSLQYKQYTLAAFLDIEGAFNNVSTNAIKEALTGIGLEGYLTHWIISMLSTRIIQSDLGGNHLTRAVNRGTPQGGAISPVLWLIVMDKILRTLDSSGVKVVAYADDLVILVSGMFLSIMSDIMEGALRKVCLWAARCGLSINPTKTQLMLFTTKTRIPEFHLPRLNEQRLVLSSNVKYLGVILDPKLNWRLNIELRVKKACIAFYACKRTFAKKWGLRPRMVLWMYTAVVRPILTYGSIVWWQALKKKYNRTKLNRIQRTACAGATGALQSCPADALNVLLHLLPLDLHIKYVAACSAVRLRESGCWAAKSYGHSNILDEIPREIWASPTDYVTRKLNFTRNFAVDLPTRAKWKTGGVLQDYDTVFFTDGSKMAYGVGAGVFSNTHGVSKSYGLPGFASVFQAEVLAILEVCRWLERDSSPKRNIAILTDSQAAIKALYSTTTSSRLVGQCRDTLNHLGGTLKITLLWVPGHRNIEGNERADGLARQGSALGSPSGNTVGVPLAAVGGRVYSHYLAAAGLRWRRLTSCAKSRRIWPAYNIARSRELLCQTRANAFKITAVCTGHWPIGDHAARLGLPYNSHCRSCGEGRETLMHFLCDCPALARVRLRTLGKPFFGDLSEISSCRVGELLSFVNATGWL